MASNKDETADTQERLEGEEELDGPSPPVPPDGGYGWVIMFASFIVNMLVDGVCFTFGLFYIEFLDYFRESKGKTSWAGSVLNGMYLSFGPITSALCNKFGCRAVTIAGSILAGISFLLATYSPNMDIVILTYGAMGGAGFGLMYLPAIVMVGFYFEKRRALATGVAVCGSGIGAFVFAPMVKVLIQEYGWKGALLVTSAITFNGIVCGVLFRPLEATTSSGKKKTITKSSSNGISNKDEKSQSIGIPHSKTNQFGPDKVHTRKRCDTDDPRILLYEKLKMEHDAKNSKDGVTRDERIFVSSHHDLCPPGSTPENDLQKCILSKSADDIWRRNSDSKDSSVRQRRITDISRPMYRKDVFYSGSITHLPEYHQSNQSGDEYSRSVTSIPRDVTEATRSCCASVKDAVGTMLDFSLLSHPVFVIYGLSCFLCMAGFFIPFIYLPDNAKELGIDKDRAAMLLSILGITNTVGRVLCGWVSDQPWADCLLINNCALIIGGAATMLCPFCKSYALLCVYASVFGLCIAVFVSLRSIIMVELMGLEKLTNAFGLVTMCQGLSAFIGAPIAGTLFDATGTYDVSFYVAGATVALAGIICLPLRKISVCYKNREEKRQIIPNVTGKKTKYALVDSDQGNSKAEAV